MCRTMNELEKVVTDYRGRVLLQHSSIAVTQRYIGIQSEEIEEALQNHIHLI